MELQKPLHTDRPRMSGIDWLNPALALGLVVVGIIGLDTFPLVAGVALAIFVWFTRHFRYDIFPDALVVSYGKPRQKVVPLDQIAEVRSVRFGFRGDSLFVRNASGRGMIIRPSDPEQFAQQLQAALERLTA